MHDDDRAHPSSTARPAPADDADVGAGAVGPTSLDLARLLRAAASGDEDAWRGIVQLYARRVYALARSRLCAHAPRPHGWARDRASAGAATPFTRGHDAAEEVTQSVFVTVAAKLSSGQYTEQGRFESWLFRVAMNRIRDEVRRTRRQAAPVDPEVLDAGPAAPAPADSSAPEQLDALRRAMSALNDSDREIVELRHHAGLSFKQMSDLLAEPLGTLLARHHRALRKLKELMTTGIAQAPADAPGDSARHHLKGDQP